MEIWNWNIPPDTIWYMTDEREDGRIANPWSFLNEFDRWWRFEVKVLEVMQARR